MAVAFADAVPESGAMLALNTLAGVPSRPESLTSLPCESSGAPDVPATRAVVGEFPEQADAALFESVLSGELAGQSSLSVGTLVAGAGTNLTVSFNANANSLAPGNYSDALSVVNTTTGQRVKVRGIDPHSADVYEGRSQVSYR